MTQWLCGSEDPWDEVFPAWHQPTGDSVWVCGHALALESPSSSGDLRKSVVLPGVVWAFRIENAS